jgi:hypothetical protein
LYSQPVSFGDTGAQTKYATCKHMM